MKKTKNKKLTAFSKILLGILFIIIASLGFFVFELYLSPNISFNKNEEKFLCIYEGDKLEDVISHLSKMGVIKDTSTFERLAKFENYQNNIIKGRYQLKNGMCNKRLLHILEKGYQTPAKLTFNNIRTKEQLAKRLSEQLMADSAKIMTQLNDTATLHAYGLTPETVDCIFIPNTYEVYWTIEPKDLIGKMWKEYNNYWNADRKQKATEIGFTPTQISILASIVEEETNNKAEKRMVAGLYINRLHKGILLQADPTVKFALGDFSIKRILREQLTIKSPYNTYMYQGLPPGPIRIPSKESIEAVLNYEKHDYLFMCAKEDLSGTHNFAKTFEEHQSNAVNYRKELNKRSIYK
jgi:UPF0755 protein